MKMLRPRIKANTAGQFGTTALPDIIFMLLFFFMVTTVVRDEDSKLRVNKPQATHVESFDEKDLSATIFIGYQRGGTIPRIQLDDRIIEITELGRLIEERRAALPEHLAGRFTTILKADKDLPMDVVIRVKQELRKVNALKLQYSVVREE